MADREKVIYDIERCICHVPDACRDCSHYQDDPELDCMEKLLADALALLKEQEAKISRISNEYLALVGKASKKPTVIRCKDCKYQEDKGRRYKDCSKHFLRAYDDFFCADGERRENE